MPPAPHNQRPLARTPHLAPDAHPAHALLTVARGLLCPAGTIANPAFSRPELEPLPIDELTMPTSDVSDLRDVFDAINRLCDTMKTSHYDELDHEDDTGSFVSSSDVTVPCKDTDSVRSVPLVPDRVSTVPRDISYDSTLGNDASLYYEAESVTSTSQVAIFTEETEIVSSHVSENPLPNESSMYQISEERLSEAIVYTEILSPENCFRTIEMSRELNWSDSLVSLPVESVTSEVACEPVSEMYYTASSEVSLLSDTEVLVVDQVAVKEDSLDDKDSQEERKDCVIAGHVAAMRERFESMTRTNTPCPDLMRSTSPSLDVFRNITPSPDRLG